ncbi:MAG: prepilin peptidase [Parafilimonas terrae]|nr:prepilin peptidase [Parafilimonas terrae]
MSVLALAPRLPPLAAAILAWTIWLGHGPTCMVVIAAGIALVAAQIARQDLATFTISDHAVVALSLFGLAARLSLAQGDGATVFDALVSTGADGLVCGGAFLAVREAFYRWRGHDGLGFGDVKLALAGGILVGTDGFAWAVLAASLGGLAVAPWIRSGPGDAPARIPFGALLAPTLWLVWLLTDGLPPIRAWFAAGGLL